MGKTRRGHKELSREQTLKHENQRLRKEISSLRKQLARIDLDRYSHVKEIVEEHLHEEEAQDADKLLESLKREWKCHVCHEGHLEILIYSKMGQPWYYRMCNNGHCDNRTKSQQYSPNVTGPVKLPEPEEKPIVKKKLSFKR